MKITPPPPAPGEGPATFSPLGAGTAGGASALLPPAAPGSSSLSTPPPWILQWLDTGVSMDRVLEMHPFQKINHFPGMSEICRKDSLTRHARRMQRLFPKDFGFIPKSWALPHDLPDFEAHLKTRKGGRGRKGSYYIAKPDHGCQGKGIFLFKAQNFAGALAQQFVRTDMIIQSYLTNPYLIDGFKFDLRVYVLVTSIHPLRIFLYRDGLVRFATTPYSDPSSKNEQDMCMHLTNYAINKHSDRFNHAEGRDTGSKRSIEAVFAQMQEWHGVDTEAIWRRIEVAVIKTLLMAQPSLSRNLQGCFRSCSLQNRFAEDAGSPCFEILGFDVFLDSKLKVWVLEVNHSPSFTCDSALDTEVKRGLILDTFRLLDFNMVRFRKFLKEQRRSSIHRLQGTMATGTGAKGAGTSSGSSNARPASTDTPPARKTEGKSTPSIAEQPAQAPDPAEQNATDKPLEPSPTSHPLTETERQLLANYHSLFPPDMLHKLRVREDKHLGNFRRIFPPEAPAELATYLKFMTIGNAKLAAETKAAEARRGFIFSKLLRDQKELVSIKSKSLSEMVRIQCSAMRTMREEKAHLLRDVLTGPRSSVPISLFPSPQVQIKRLQGKLGRPPSGGVGAADAPAQGRAGGARRAVPVAARPHLGLGHPAVSATGLPVFGSRRPSLPHPLAAGDASLGNLVIRDLDLLQVQAEGTASRYGPPCVRLVGLRGLE